MLWRGSHLSKPGTLHLRPFEANLGIQVLFGDGVVRRLGQAARDLGASRALIVTDPGVHASGAVDKAVASLNGSGISWAVFSGVEENPTTLHVQNGTAFAARQHPDLLVGLGGGSAMDCAKGINFLLSNGGRIEDYWGFGKASRPMLPSIGVPTTTGTGSEAQSYALIASPGDHRKMACGDRKARFHTVLLDPELTDTLPRSVLATSAMDACSHALESHVCRRWTPVSRMFSGQAWDLLESAFEGALLEDETRAARGRLLLGAHLAGWAIESSMLGAAHACANPLTARFGVVHGAAVGMMLPHVIRFNDSAVNGDYELLLGSRRSRSGGAGECLANRIAELRTRAGLPQRLRDVGVSQDALQGLATDAAKEWTGGFNPRPVAPADCLELYRKAY